ncbi:acyltransferase [Chromohalobacter japonicus]|uniref:acyltransferase n=1 Tax=Chromohalobacter japonicus TaxID=223900 RepID=UPI000590FC23|nr:acyltransferase [Chromohalobacter japonicus]
MATLKGLTSVLWLIANTLFWSVPLYLLTLLKLVTPTRRLRLRVLAGLNAIALAWIATNNWWIRHWVKPNITAHLPEGLSPSQWWLVIANHRSWTDIFVMQYVLYGRTSMPKFFLKRELIFIPIIGLAWWALEFPFMRRYARSELTQRPKLAERDRRATQRMCERAREMPMTIYNFVEGTRFTPAKRDRQASPFRHLLRPKAGGTAQVIRLMGDRLSGILDVTLHYRHVAPNFWHFLCGRETPIHMEARRLNVPAWMGNGDYHLDPHYKERFHSWLNALWEEKDRALASFPSSSLS